MKLRPLILCADDFGMSLQTSQVIARLASDGRLSAVSCMAGMPNWPEAAKLLLPLAGQIDVGIHLTMTGERPLTPMPQLAPEGRLPSLDRLMALAFRGRLPLGEIEAELRAQLVAFAAAMGRAPDFVDAHQHFHCFPGIRARLLALVAEVAPHAWLRTCEDRLPRMLARPYPLRALRSSLLCLNLARDAAKHGLRTNNSFAGYYDYRPDTDFGALFAGYLKAPGSAHLIMVHPGAADDPDDSISGARLNEAAFIGSAAFAAGLAAAGLKLTRGSAVIPALDKPAVLP